MSGLRLKTDVRLCGLRPQMVVALMVITRVFEAQGYECVVTSANDSKHGYGSLHFSGGALDFRMKHVRESTKELIVEEVKGSLTKEFDVLLEYRGMENEHMHIEFQPKEK